MHMDNIKEVFPVFETYPDLVYLDSAATSLTPLSVIDKTREYYTTYNANIARGLYTMSTRATEEFEQSRSDIADFVGAQHDEIVFTSGTTMSLNMIARGIAHTITPDDTIVTTAMEHHANFIPWQEIAHDTGAAFHVAPITGHGTLDIHALLDLITPHTKIVALTHVSNVLGTINPLKDIIHDIRQKNPHTLIVVDAAQSLAHIPLNVVDIDCDFAAFSFHKAFGPTGIGALYGKKHVLEQLRPLFTGGEMIESVSTTCTTFRELPHRLEAGTPHISGAIAAGEAIRFIQAIGYDTMRTHEKELLTYCTHSLTQAFNDRITILGPTDISERSGLISFTLDPHHPHDIAAILDHEHAIAIRAGQHCTMPLHTEFLHVPASARASFSIYNTTQDIDILIDGLHKVDAILST